MWTQQKKNIKHTQTKTRRARSSKETNQAYLLMPGAEWGWINNSSQGCCMHALIIT